MNAGQLAALVAAGFFAILACVATYVLIRLARLMSAVTGMVTDYKARADQLIGQAQAAVDRTNEQLIRTDAITASMDQVTANMAELSGHVSALAGLARGISTAASAPLTGLAAFAFGLRRAIVVRRSLEATVAQSLPEAVRSPGPRPAITATVTRVPRQRTGPGDGRVSVASQDAGTDGTGSQDGDSQRGGVRQRDRGVTATRGDRARRA